MFRRYVSLFICSFIFSTSIFASDPTVLIAILARNKAHFLPTFLQCINNLEYDKKSISIYINTNNNEDDTVEILEEWMNKHRSQYRNIEMEQHEIKDLDNTLPHEWTVPRFKILGAIRNKSLAKTKEHHCDYYFVVDCDNFIKPNTLKILVQKAKPIIAPMLRSIPRKHSTYSNFFCDITETGYYQPHEDYYPILHRKKIGTFQAPVVHCTYLIDSKYVDQLSYLDGTDDYEFVIFSRIARQKQIEQFICNEVNFGVLWEWDPLGQNQKITLAQERELFANYLKDHPDFLK